MGLWRKLRWSLAQRGLIGTLRAVPAALTRRSPADLQHPFDQRYGTDTSGLIGGAALATGHRHDPYITAYAGVAPSRFETAMDRWRGTLGDAKIEDYTFIDLGCGKGRALLLASRFPFREVVGIELNSRLAGIAQSNLKRWQSLAETSSPIRIIVGDATDPDLGGGPALLFLYNAFAERLVCRLADNIARSKDSARTDVIYQNAYHADVFTHRAGFRELWRAELPLCAEDAAADPVASPRDITVLLRLDAAAQRGV
ncbi:MAG TPA: class I SAM-dependent methyltransferase [Bryocella sp.]|nr:class I SAM-dependent methyltransferase [Bryocella sp.]